MKEFWKQKNQRAFRSNPQVTNWALLTSSNTRAETFSEHKHLLHHCILSLIFFGFHKLLSHNFICFLCIQIRFGVGLFPPTSVNVGANPFAIIGCIISTFHCSLLELQLYQVFSMCVIFCGSCAVVISSFLHFFHFTFKKKIYIYIYIYINSK